MKTESIPSPDTCSCTSVPLSCTSSCTYRVQRVDSSFSPLCVHLITGPEEQESRPHLGHQDASWEHVTFAMEAKNLTDRVQDLGLSSGQVVTKISIVTPTVGVGGEEGTDETGKLTGQSGASASSGILAPEWLRHEDGDVLPIELSALVPKQIQQHLVGHLYHALCVDHAHRAVPGVDLPQARTRCAQDQDMM